MSCSSCGLSLKKEWNDIIGSEETQAISEHTFHISEYLLLLKEKGELVEDFTPVKEKIGYHTPCHLKVQGEASKSSIQLLQLIPGLDVQAINQGCCGICGSWGMKKENYEVSLQIGSDLFHDMNKTEIQEGITDCPTCELQLKHATTKHIRHPVEVLAEAYELKED